MSRHLGFPLKIMRNDLSVLTREKYQMSPYYLLQLEELIEKGLVMHDPLGDYYNCLGLYR